MGYDSFAGAWQNSAACVPLDATQGLIPICFSGFLFAGQVFGKWPGCLLNIHSGHSSDRVRWISSNRWNRQRTNCGPDGGGCVPDI